MDVMIWTQVGKIDGRYIVFDQGRKGRWTALQWNQKDDSKLVRLHKE